jgi:hypothetical protein
MISTSTTSPSAEISAFILTTPRTRLVRTTSGYLGLDVPQYFRCVVRTGHLQRAAELRLNDLTGGRGWMILLRWCAGAATTFKNNARIAI